MFPICSLRLVYIGNVFKVIMSVTIAHDSHYCTWMSILLYMPETPWQHDHRHHDI